MNKYVSHHEVYFKKLLISLWYGKYLILFCIVLSIILSVNSIRNSITTYELKTTVRFKSNSDFPTKAISGSEYFFVFGKFIKSHEISKKLFQEERVINHFFSKEWDNTKKEFKKEKKENGFFIKEYLLQLLTGRDIFKYRPPDPSRLLEKYRGRISIEALNFPSLVEISLKSSDKFFDKYFLNLLVLSTDEHIQKDFLKKLKNSIVEDQENIQISNKQWRRAIFADRIRKNSLAYFLADDKFVSNVEIVRKPYVEVSTIKPNVTHLLVSNSLIGFYIGAILSLVGFFSRGIYLSR